jgi:hypothetical protein
MRDPELVFKAQLAASALERAWQHWRVVHGLLADPMPAISSYVGYSLEEPWGQPRVVFGLAVADAEQLTALLERHDCGGPGRQLPVPPQAPSPHAEPKISADVLSRTARIAPGTDQAVEEDGPVYRQLTAALRAARDATAVRATREPESSEQDPAGQETPGPHQPREEHIGEEPAGQEAVGVAGGADETPAVHDTIGSQTSSKGRSSRTGDSGGLGQHDTKSDSNAVSPRKAGGRQPRAGRGSHNRSGASRAGATPGGDAANVAAAATSAVGGEDAAAPAPATSATEREDADADSDVAEQAADHLGPLALAASAARVAAEARIRAAAQQASPPVLEQPQAGADVEVADPAAVPADGGTDLPAADDDRPNSASANSPKVVAPGSGDIAAVWGGPGLTTAGADEAGIVRFWPFSQDGAAEGDPAPDRSASEPQNRPPANYGRRARTSRGYSIPRLSRAKRPGPVPGP